MLVMLNHLQLEHQRFARFKARSNSGSNSREVSVSVLCCEMTDKRSLLISY